MNNALIAYFVKNMNNEYSIFIAQTIWLYFVGNA